MPDKTTQGKANSVPGLEEGFLTRLADLAQAVSRGETAQRCGPPYPEGELGRLAEALDRTAQNIIADRRRHEAVLNDAAREHRFTSALFDAAAIYILVLDPQGVIVRTNPAADELLGLPPREIIGRPFWEFLADETEAAEVRRKFRDRRWSRSGPTRTNRWLAADGEPRWIAFTEAAMSDEGGRIQYIVSTGLDLTEQKRIEERLALTRDRYRGIFMSSREGIVVADLEGRIVDANPMAAEHLGYGSVEEIIGLQTADSYAQPEDRVRMMNELLSRGYVQSFEREILRPDGSSLPVLCSTFLNRDASGQPVGLIGVCTDISELKATYQELVRHRNRLEELVAGRTEELLEANRRLEKEVAARRAAQAELNNYAQELVRSNEELEQFAYIASHDLQEPLRKMASFTGLLEKNLGPALDEKTTKYMWFVTDGAQRMQALIDSLLTYSRTGRGDLKLSPTNLAEPLQRALADLEPAIESCSARFNIGPLPVLPVEPVLISQVFQNLIGNALKFHGPEQCRIDIQAGQTEEGWLVAISDNGIGIPDREQDKVFNIFHRARNTQDFHGAGIGLSVCKKIIEKHGGRLWVESQEGRGTTFFFILPGSDS